MMLTAFSVIVQAAFSSPTDRVLVATPVKNAANELPNYFASLKSISYPKNLITIAFLESDSTDQTDEVIRAFITLDSSEFGSVLYQRKPVGYSPPLNRHAEDIQLRRRQTLARARNDVLDMVDLANFEYVLWLDADAVGFPDTLIQDLIGLRQDVVAPHVVWKLGGTTYDRNSWLELRPDEVWGEPLEHKDARLPSESVMFEGYSNGIGRRIYLDDYRLLLSPGDRLATVPLNGVGTAVLLVKAQVHQKFRFPEQPFKRRLESEGFGLLVFSNGIRPVGLPMYEIRHVNAEDGGWIYGGAAAYLNRMNRRLQRAERVKNGIPVVLFYETLEDFTDNLMHAIPINGVFLITLSICLTYLAIVGIRLLRRRLKVEPGRMSPKRRNRRSPTP